MRRHKILHENSIWENHGQERKNSLFQEVIVNSAELELCGNIRLHRDNDLRRRILWIFRVWSLLFSGGWFLWRSVGGISLPKKSWPPFHHRSPSVYILGSLHWQCVSCRFNNRMICTLWFFHNGLNYTLDCESDFCYLL